jgi:(S)-sulfolactate dehydrogenase
VGLDNIDVAGCRARDIQVIPATGANAQSVAEYVVATAMLLLRGAYLSSAEVAAGKWPRNALANGRETAGKTLGIVGFGSIGQFTAQLAGAVGMQVLAFDALLDPADPAWAAAVAQPASLDEVVGRADVVSLHLPLLESTRGLFDAQRLAAMKRGAVAHQHLAWRHRRRGGTGHRAQGAGNSAALQSTSSKPSRCRPRRTSITAPTCC